MTAISCKRKESRNPLRGKTLRLMELSDSLGYRDPVGSCAEESSGEGSLRSRDKSGIGGSPCYEAGVSAIPGPSGALLGRPILLGHIRISSSYCSSRTTITVSVDPAKRQRCVFHRQLQYVSRAN